MLQKACKDDNENDDDLVKVTEHLPRRVFIDHEQQTSLISNSHDRVSTEKRHDTEFELEDEGRRRSHSRVKSQPDFIQDDAIFIETSNNHFSKDAIDELYSQAVQPSSKLQLR